MSEDTTNEGEVKHFKSTDFKMIDPPSDQLIGMWRDLFAKMNSDPCEPDPLTPKERDLYDILTDRLSAHLAMLGYTEKVLDQDGNEYKIS
jgi:hypothetical protein